jgi:histidine ammonia-lyase
VDSIPTSAGQEDHVSMGNASGLKAWQVLANAERALAIELIAGAQAVEFLAPLEPGIGVRATHAFVRTHSARLRDDRPLSHDIESVAGAIRDGSLERAVEADAGELA